jgi:hypothetical protein
MLKFSIMHRAVAIHWKASMAWDYRKDVVAPVKAAEESIIECDERDE